MDRLAGPKRIKGIKKSSGRLLTELKDKYVHHLKEFQRDKQENRMKNEKKKVKQAVEDLEVGWTFSKIREPAWFFSRSLQFTAHSNEARAKSKLIIKITRKEETK